MSSGLMDALALGGVYALIAVGYTLVYGIIKLINFAHGEFFMAAAFAGYFVLEYVETGSPAADFLIAILAGAALASALALATERVGYRPLRREALGAVRIAEIVLPLPWALLVLGLVPERHAWAGAAVAIAGMMALSKAGGAVARRTARRSSKSAARSAAAMMFVAVFACIAGLTLRGQIWGVLGWEGGQALTAGRLAAGVAAGLGGGVLAALLALVVGETELKRASRIAGLLTALGVSLFLQTLAMRLWTAAERGCRNPFERRYYTLGEVEEGRPGADHGDLGYSVREGGRVHKALLAPAGEAPSEDALAEARRAGAGRIYEARTVPAGSKQLLVLLVAAVSTAGLTAVVKFTRYGKAMRALSEDADAARLVGVNPDRVIAFTFFLGAALAGVAGVLIATYYGSVKPMMGYAYGIKAFIAAVVGGIGSVPGACVGGLVLGMSERLFGELFPQGAARDVAAFGLLILILLVRPAGILGRKELRRT